MILTKYDSKFAGRLTEQFVTVGFVILRFYCTCKKLCLLEEKSPLNIKSGTEIVLSQRERYVFGEKIIILICLWENNSPLVIAMYCS